MSQRSRKNLSRIGLLAMLCAVVVGTMFAPSISDAAGRVTYKWVAVEEPAAGASVAPAVQSTYGTDDYVPSPGPGPAPAPDLRNTNCASSTGYQAPAFTYSWQAAPVQTYSSVRTYSVPMQSVQSYSSCGGMQAVQSVQSYSSSCGGGGFEASRPVSRRAVRLQAKAAAASVRASY